MKGTITISSSDAEMVIRDNSIDIIRCRKASSNKRVLVRASGSNVLDGVVDAFLASFKNKDSD